MKKISKFLTFVCALALAGLLMAPAFAAGQPEISVSSASCKVGDTVQVTLSLKNVKNFTSGDINIQYNPNILYLTGVTESAAMNSDSSINMLYSEVLPKGAKDDDGEPVHTFDLSLFHIEKFPQSLDTCDVLTLSFEAVGGGQCPLVLSASSFAIDERETVPLFNSGMVTVEGAAAAGWDYAEHVVPAVEYTDASYPFAPASTTASAPAQSVIISGDDKTDSDGAQSLMIGNSSAVGNVANNTDKKKISVGKILGISAAVVLVIGGVAAAVIVSGKNKYVEDET
ncbi:MAG: hypothetical protein IJ766_09490 [Clostridia bacterium]|nr:hypothetical protein [Clostridia bacterium]